VRRTLSLAFVALAAGVFAQPFPFELEADKRPKLKTGGNVLIRGARVMTATKGTLDHTDVLVRDGKIAAIGKNLAAPQGVVVVDARGKVLAPGIVDGHSHRASDGTNEGAESLTPETRIGDVLNLGANNAWQALASGHTTAVILHGSANAVGGESVVIKYKFQRPAREAVVKTAPRQVKFALGENVTQKNSTSGSRWPRSRMGVEALYRRAFNEARAYASAWEAFRNGKSTKPPRKDIRLDTLSDILAGKVWVQCHSYRSDEMLMMVRLSQEYGFKLGALQHALEAYKIAPELAKAGVGVSIFVDNWSFKVEGYDAIPWNAAICLTQGVNVSINTDGVSGTTALNIDAAKVMRFGGLSEQTALQTITINTAKQLGIDKQVGSIEVGKDADLALWSASPLSVYAKCLMTMIEGEVFFERRDAFGVDAGFQAPPLLEAKPKADAKPLRQANTYAIVDAAIYPVSSAPIPRGTVVVSKGRITAVGVNVPVPSGAVVVRGKGLRVYPGFFDAYSTLGLGEISPVATMMDTTELGSTQPDLDAATALWVESAHWGPARYNGITNAFTGPSFGSVSGQGAVVNTDGYTTEEFTLLRKAGLMVNFPGGRGPIEFDACDEVADASRILGMGGADDDDDRDHGHSHTVSGDQDLTLEQRELFYHLLGGGQEFQIEGAGAGGDTEALAEYFDQAREYYKRRKADPSSRISVTLEALRPYLEEKRLMVLAVRNAASIRAAVAFAKEQKLNVALRGASGAWRETKLLRESGIPVIITPAGRSTLSANLPDNAWDPYDTPYALPGLLEKGGVKFSFGSSSPAEVMNLAVRVGQHRSYGLSEAAALRALTLTPAETFGVAKEIGSLEVGKRGTLIVTDGDPFEMTTSFRHVFIDGTPRSLSTKHTLLRDKYWGRIAR
jgi:imidazolonepropionase-like amidohydrolase